MLLLFQQRNPPIASNNISGYIDGREGYNTIDLTRITSSSKNNSGYDIIANLMKGFLTDNNDFNIQLKNIQKLFRTKKIKLIKFIQIVAQN